MLRCYASRYSPPPEADRPIAHPATLDPPPASQKISTQSHSLYQVQVLMATGNMSQAELQWKLDSAGKNACLVSF